MIVRYSRVSKGDEQNNKLQLQAFKTAKVEKVFEERASGGRWDRPILHNMLDQLCEGDIVIVWKLDRLSRSLKDLLVIIERINKAGAGLEAARKEGRIGGLNKNQREDIADNVISERKSGADIVRHL